MMKKLNIFKKTVHYSLCTVLLSMGLTGCSDDLSFRVDTPTTDDNTLTIMIPNVEGAAEYGATRADGYAQTRAGEAEEGTIDHLYLLAYPITSSGAADTNREVIFANLNNPNELNVTSGTSDTDYKQYTVSGFMKGDYCVYLVANVNKYLSSGVTINKDLSESSLRQLLLNFDTNKKIERGYIPMGCLNTEIKTANNGNAISNGILSFDKGTTIYADMKFLCAKVRYTILFDRNSVSGKNFSSQFSSNDVDFNKDVAVSNVVPQIRWTTEGTLSNTTKFGTTATLSCVEYPTNVNYFNIESITGSESAPADLLEAGDWASPDQRAWQGVVYLPENNVTGTNATKLTFTPSGDEIKSENCTFTLSWTTPSPAHGIERSKMYDLVAKLQETTNVELTASVNILPWDAQHLAYTLHGPYSLEVEKTEIKVDAGSWSDPIWYRSDVAPTAIGFNFPTISANGSDIPFFQAQVIRATYANEKSLKDFVAGTKDGYCINKNGDYLIRVRVNPNVPYSVLKNITTDEQKKPYNYFEIKAGAVAKKIKANPLNLDGFLTVDPQEIIVNVKEYISSGTESGSQLIEIATNISNSLKIRVVSVSGDEDNETETENTALYSISETNPFGLSCETGTSISGTSAERDLTITNGEGNIYLNFEKLFDGISYWQTKHKYYIYITVSSDGVTKTEKVTVKVVPFTTNYTIHFRCKDASKDWNSPHIYVYQCLELPADLKTSSGNKHPHAGKTVGYREGSNNNYSYYTAIEYAFTNDFGFRGWKGYGGPTDNTYDPNQSYYYESTGNNYTNGFVIFQTNWGWDYCLKSREESKFTCVYDQNMHFNDHHTKRSACPTCAAGYLTYNYEKGPNGTTNAENESQEWRITNSRLWPGIVMEKETGENEGWWKYELTGVATPGKAMIMFANGHVAEGKGSGLRYPGDDKVGIPLFDFPDNEGWFEYDGSSTDPGLFFKDDKPSGSGSGSGGGGGTGDDPDKITIYWDNSSKNYSTPYAYYYKEGVKDTPGWAGEPMTLLSGTIYKISITKNVEDGFVIFSNNGGNQVPSETGFKIKKDHIYTANGIMGQQRYYNDNTNNYFYFVDETSNYIKTPIVKFYDSTSGESWYTLTSTSKPGGANGNWYRVQIPNVYKNANFIIYNNFESPNSEGYSGNDWRLWNENRYSGYYNNSGGNGWYSRNYP